MQVSHVARRAIKRLGLAGAASAIAPGLRRSAAFDGLTGVAFTGWIGGGVEPVVTLYYGGEALISAAANIERPDTVQAGVVDARGFAFTLSAVEAAMRKRYAVADKEPRMLEVRDAGGRPLEGAHAEVSPAEFLRLAALGCATQLLGTQTGGLF